MAKTVKKQVIKPVKTKKEQRIERQALILIFVFIAIIAAFLTAYYLPKSLKKPYFEFHGFKVYAVQLAGSNMIFYNIPDVIFTVQGLEYKNNVVIRNDPREIEKSNMSINVNDIFFKTMPLQLWMSWNSEEMAKIYEAEIEIKKFANNLNIPVGIIPLNLTWSCENSSTEKRTIFLKTTNTTKIYENESYPYCITIEADSYDNLIKACDSFVIEWLLRISK